MSGMVIMTLADFFPAASHMSICHRTLQAMAIWPSYCYALVHELRCSAIIQGGCSQSGNDSEAGEISASEVAIN